jgi:transposase
MACLRKSVAMQKQFYELFDKGHKIRAIARTLKIGRNTVRRILKLRESPSATNLSPLAPQDSSAINWAEVIKERARGICLKVLQAEHAPSDWDYHKFWRELKKHAPKEPADIPMRMDHKPAEKTFFDFADGIGIVNPKTGEVTKTQFFCAVLPFSSFTYGEFAANQQQPTFCGAIENAFAFFGGTTNYVTIDNLKAGISKAHIYDPDVNPVFCLCLCKSLEFCSTPCKAL